MNTLPQMIAVMQAFERGEPIEVKKIGTSPEKFEPCPIPCWDWTRFEFQVKPKPREWWLSIHPTDPRKVFVFSTWEDATRWDKGFGRIVRVVEAYTDPDLQSLEL